MAALDETESALLRERCPNLADPGVELDSTGVVADGNSACCGPGLALGLSVRADVPQKLPSKSLVIGLSRRFSRCPESELMVLLLSVGIFVARVWENFLERKPVSAELWRVCVFD